MTGEQVAAITDRFAELSDRELRRGFRKVCRAFRDHTASFDMEMAELSLAFIDGLLDEANRRMAARPPRDLRN